MEVPLPEITTSDRVAAVKQLQTLTEAGRLDWIATLRGWKAAIGRFTVHVDATAQAITLACGEAHIADLGAGVNGSYRLIDAIRRTTNDEDARRRRFAEFKGALEEVQKRGKSAKSAH